MGKSTVTFDYHHAGMDLEVTADCYSGSPARMYGAWEDCCEAEGAEAEITSATHCGVEVDVDEMIVGAKVIYNTDIIQYTYLCEELCDKALEVAAEEDY